MLRKVVTGLPCAHCSQGRLVVTCEGVSDDGHAVRIEFACTRCTFKKQKDLWTEIGRELSGAY
jgi:hypothetical protein